MANKKTIFFLCAVVVAMLMFPPWIRETKNLRNGRTVGLYPIGHRLIFDPLGARRGELIYIDWQRLALQLGAVGIIAGGVFVFRRKD